MTYSHRLTIAAPVAMIDSANAIARSMDPDVGGAESFASVRATDANGAEYVVCDVWVREGFALQAAAMLNNPIMLHGACAQDYAVRWPDLIPPTLQECGQFISNSFIVINQRSNTTVQEVLETIGLQYKKPENNQ